jgi:hypothetical protein
MIMGRYTVTSYFDALLAINLCRVTDNSGDNALKTTVAVFYDEGMAKEYCEFKNNQSPKENDCGKIYPYS